MWLIEPRKIKFVIAAGSSMRSLIGPKSEQNSSNPHLQMSQSDLTDLSSRKDIFNSTFLCAKWYFKLYLSKSGHLTLSGSFTFKYFRSFVSWNFCLSKNISITTEISTTDRTVIFPTVLWSLYILRWSLPQQWNCKVLVSQFPFVHSEYLTSRTNIFIKGTHTKKILLCNLLKYYRHVSSWSNK